MFREIFTIVVEEASKRSYASPGQLVSPRQNVIFAGNFSRVLISIVGLWILGAGTIIFLKAFPYLSPICAAANGVLSLASIFTLYTLWWRPFSAPKALVYSCILIAITAPVVFFLLIPAEADFRQPDLFWSFMMLIPSSVVFLLCVLAGRRPILLMNHVFLFSDEIEDRQSQSSNNKAEESAIEVVE